MCTSLNRYSITLSVICVYIKHICVCGCIDAADESCNYNIVLLPAAEAYGEYNPEMVQELPRDQFQGIELQKGMTLYGQTPDGQTIAVTVKDFDDNKVVIDYNHPLAGEDLTFEVKLVNKREATPEEALTGQVGGAHEHCGSGNCGCGH